MRNFKVRNHKFFKNYVFMLSVFEGCAYWTAHKYEGDKRIDLSVLCDLFQRDHNIQVEGMIAEALAKESAEMMQLTVEQDDRSRKLIESLPEEKRKALMKEFGKNIDHETI